MRSMLALALTLVASACGGAPATPAAPPNPGDIDATPTLGALPDPGVPREELTERMRLGWQLAAGSTVIEMPAPPARRDAATLEAWAQGPLSMWLTQKSRAIEAARQELDLAAEESSRQRIIGGAIVGLIYENAARALLTLPTPEELSNEPEIAAAYRDVVAFNASPYLEHSRLAYRACAQNARVHEATMGIWAPFCAGRGERLPTGRAQPMEAPDATGLGENETVIEVIRE